MSFSVKQAQVWEMKIQPQDGISFSQEHPAMGRNIAENKMKQR